MDDRSTSVDKMSEALQLLEDAASQEKSEIQNLLKDRYTHLKEVIMGTQHSLTDTLNHTRDKAYAKAHHAKEYSVEKAKIVDERVHENPWPYVAGATVFGLLTGYILGRNANR